MQQLLYSKWSGLNGVFGSSMPEQWVWGQNIKILWMSGCARCLISSRIFKHVFICCYHWISRKKRVDLCIENQQRSIDWLFGDPLIINSHIAQHLMSNAVWQQQKQHHLQLHCAECWQLLQNPLLGKWGKSVLHRGHLSFFYLHGYVQVTFIHFWMPHPLSDCSPEWHSHFRLDKVTQWCYWWWFSFSRALTKHGFIKYVMASLIHWSMIFCSTTSWWKIKGWRQGHFPFVVTYNMVFKLCLL